MANLDRRFRGPGRAPSLLGFLASLLLWALGACSGSPTASSPAMLAVFTDSQSGVRTSDVYDVDGDLLRFDAASGMLTWAATGSTFPGYPVSGNHIGAGHAFTVRFGTHGGARRAFFTETASGTICDVALHGSSLSILPTSVPVPQ